MDNVLINPNCKSLPDYEIFHKISDEFAVSCECRNELSVFINVGDLVIRCGAFGFSEKTPLHRASSIDISNSLF